MTSFVNPHEQHILAVPRERLIAAGLVSGFTSAGRTLALLKEIRSSGQFLPRSTVESESELLQPIPCAIVQADKRVLILERHEKEKSHPLHQRLVLWAGGHVQLEDMDAFPVDLMVAALGRELHEELDLETGRAHLRGVIYDGVSSHFAVTFAVPALIPRGARVATNGEFRASKGRSSPNGRFLEPQDIQTRYAELESWSRVILSDILLRGRPLMLPAEARPELELDFGASPPVPVLGASPA